MGTVNKLQEIDMRQVLEELRSINKEMAVIKSKCNYAVFKTAEEEHFNVKLGYACLGYKSLTEQKKKIFFKVLLLLP